MYRVPPLVKRSAVVGAAVSLAVAAGVVALTVTAGPSNAASCNGYVALTFDDGPNAGNTNNLLNTLQKAGVRATLFNIGNNARNNPSLVKAEQNAKMWIGNHSMSHSHMAGMSVQQASNELSQTNQAITQAGGTKPTVFRPPYGESSGNLQSAASQNGLKLVTWDVDSQDWNGASTQAIVQAASRLQAGQIILMHDQYQTTIQAIPQIVSGLSSRNLCAGMISPSTGRAVAPTN